MSQAHSLSDTAKRMNCPSHILTFHAVTSLADVLSAVGVCLSARARACTRGQPTTRKASCYAGGYPGRVDAVPHPPAWAFCGGDRLSIKVNVAPRCVAATATCASVSFDVRRARYARRRALLRVGVADLPPVCASTLGYLEDKAGGFVPPNVTSVGSTQRGLASAYLPLGARSGGPPTTTSCGSLCVLGGIGLAADRPLDLLQ